MSVCACVAEAEEGRAGNGKILTGWADECLFDRLCHYWGVVWDVEQDEDERGEADDGAEGNNWPAANAVGPGAEDAKDGSTKDLTHTNKDAVKP